MLSITALPVLAEPIQEGDEKGAIVGVRFGDHTSKLRAVLDISTEPDFEIGYSADPMAVIVDFPDLALQVSPFGSGIGFIKGYEIGRRADGGIRVRFSLRRPARAGQVFYLPATPTTTPRFVLDLTPTNPADLETLAGLSGAAVEAAPDETAEAAPDETPDETPAQTDPLADIIQTASLFAPSPGDFSPPDPAEEESQPLPAFVPVPIPQPKPEPPLLPVIVLDPGHGGYDPGAVSKSGLREKDITLSAAKVLKRLLQRSGLYEVLMTREEDSFLPLRERVTFARNAGAAMFLSLHADSINDPQVRGASVYTLSEVASDREAEALAMRENRAGALTGISLDEQDDDMTVSILIDLAQRQSRSYSTHLADLVIAGIGNVQPIVGNTHRRAGFAVLTAPDVPSILVELGYLSSTEDEQILRDEHHIARLMRAIGSAIDRYFAWQADRHPPG